MHLYHVTFDLATQRARMLNAANYGHSWPDADESTRLADGAVTAERMDSLELVRANCGLNVVVQSELPPAGIRGFAGICV